MGVGVFSDDFQGTGSTFIVSSEYYSEDEYKEYLDSIATENDITADECEDGCWNFRKSNDVEPKKDDLYWEEGQHNSKEDALKAAFEKFDIDFSSSFESWSQENYDDFNSNFIEVIKRAGTELGLSISEYTNINSRHITRASFDSDFCELLNDPVKNMFSVGWRSWENDYIVGIGANQASHFGSAYSWQDVLSDHYSQYHAADIISYLGQSPKKFANDYKTMIDSVAEYIRLSLMESGLACSFKTSGYTTGCYELPDSDDLNKRYQEIKAIVNNWNSSMEKTASNAIVDATTEELSDIIKVISENKECQQDLQIEMPLYNCSEGAILWITPNQDSEDTNVISIAASVCPADMKNYFAGLSQSNGFAPIPRNDITSDWYKSVQERINTDGRNSNGKLRIAISAEEFLSATKDDITFEYGDDTINLTPAKKSKMRM